MNCAFIEHICPIEYAMNFMYVRIHVNVLRRSDVLNFDKGHYHGSDRLEVSCSHANMQSMRIFA